MKQENAVDAREDDDDDERPIEISVGGGVNDVKILYAYAADSFVSCGFVVRR